MPDQALCHKGKGTSFGVSKDSNGANIDPKEVGSISLTLKTSLRFTTVVEQRNVGKHRRFLNYGNF